ncbi:MAG: hypothetical protein IPP83_08890 [Flavobacteriales bacterium]|nr:hypothetical protein [Flavobacteriales bacterium]
MLSFRSIAAAAMCSTLVATAQDMALSGGTLTVMPGTTMEVVGPLTWQLGTGAQVVNHGLIDLGTEGVLVEQDGAPVTGTGTEKATWALPGPLTNVVPGGLGATLSTDYAGADLVVERGHTPVQASNGVWSIARWYRITTPQSNTDAVVVDLHYDVTELNGITEPTLGLFVAPQYTGPWTGVASVLNMGSQTISGTDQAPVAFITAFDADAVNGIDRNEAIIELRAWPSVFTDRILVSLEDGRPITSVELFDAQGRSVWRSAPLARNGGILTIQPPSLATGPYVLRVNELWGAKLIKE